METHNNAENTRIYRFSVCLLPWTLVGSQRTEFWIIIPCCVCIYECIFLNRNTHFLYLHLSIDRCIIINGRRPSWTRVDARGRSQTEEWDSIHPTNQPKQPNKQPSQLHQRARRTLSNNTNVRHQRHHRKSINLTNKTSSCACTSSCLDEAHHYVLHTYACHALCTQYVH